METAGTSPLDELERQERWGNAKGALTLVGAGLIFGGLVGVFYVARSEREVAGEVVTAAASTADAAVVRAITVKTDDGPTVRASIDDHVSAKPTQRVILSERTMLLGWRQYEFRRFE